MGVTVFPMSTNPLRCHEIYFLSISTYIAKTPCQYDKKEMLMQLGSVSGPSFFSGLGLLRGLGKLDGPRMGWYDSSMVRGGEDFKVNVVNVGLQGGHQGVLQGV